MKRINSGFILPSAAYTIDKDQIRYRTQSDKKPEVGDLIYGKVLNLGAHSKLENKEGRIHSINLNTKAVFVYGSRYAPDAFEGEVPAQYSSEVDLLARSGMVGKVISKNSLYLNCTKVKSLGYVCDSTGKILNTKYYPLINKGLRSKKPKAKMILCIGAAMNSGKSYSAARACWALSTAGHLVKGTKVTGTSCLKDILLMEDNGASRVADFTILGYPSTYLLNEEEILHIFSTLENNFGRHKGYWVVEFADGIFQKETAMLLRNDRIKKRIHKLVYCAHDAAGVLGGIKILEQDFGLAPDAISGCCSSSPLAIKEFRRHTDIPTFDSMANNLEKVLDILL